MLHAEGCCCYYVYRQKGAAGDRIKGSGIGEKSINATRTSSGKRRRTDCMKTSLSLSLSPPPLLSTRRTRQSFSYPPSPLSGPIVASVSSARPRLPLERNPQCPCASCSPRRKHHIPHEFDRQHLKHIHLVLFPNMNLDCAHLRPRGVQPSALPSRGHTPGIHFQPIDGPRWGWSQNPSSPVIWSSRPLLRLLSRALAKLSFACTLSNCSTPIHLLAIAALAP